MVEKQRPTFRCLHDTYVVTVEIPATETPARLDRESSGEALLEELQPLVVRVVRLVVGAGSTVAEDAAQEALLELTRSLPRLRNREAAPAFAGQVATRVALRVAKRERRFALLGLRVSESGDERCSGEAAELLELKEAFDRLPPRQRATAVLRLYVGLTEQETAEVLGCSVGTVKHQLHDARHTLSAFLDGKEPTGRKRGRK